MRFSGCGLDMGYHCLNPDKTNFGFKKKSFHPNPNVSFPVSPGLFTPKQGNPHKIPVKTGVTKTGAKIYIKDK